MNAYFVTYRSLTQAQRARRELEQRGILSTLQRTPKALQTGGCGYGLRLSEREFIRAVPLPGGAQGVFLRRTNGGWEAQT